MISISNLGMSYGARSLFAGVSLKLNSGARYGLVGANGSGKTTFLSILSADLAPSEGSVSIPKRARVGVLRQDRFLNDDEIIVEVAAQGDDVTWAAILEQRAIERGEGDASRAADVDEILRAREGYTLEARAGQVLLGLGIPTHVHRQPLRVLSGGFKLRVLLAQALLGGADVLFLDEPTNHLDILSIRWLEKFLMGYRGCAVVISHDQRFLDNVATHILDVDYDTVTMYTGNYAAFVREKTAVREQKLAEIERTEAVIAHKQAYVDRFRYKASKASQAQSILKQLEKIEVEELAESSRREPQFAFQQRRPSGRDVLEVRGIAKTYTSKPVLKNLSLVLRRGEKLGVIGPNGLGKSTLLRILVGTTSPDEGTVQWGYETQVGYFAQDHREVLTDANATAMEVIQQTQPDATIPFVRGTLGKMLFSGDAAFKRVASLSGGEAARLVFGRLMVEMPNVLVLDEPTNHLDLESIDALVRALKAYEGTLIFVSHDRRFVSDIATRILELTPDGPNDFPGTFAEYLERCGDDHLDAESVALKARREKSSAQSSAPNSGQTREEQKRRKQKLQQLATRRDRAFAAVEAAEKRLAEIHALFATEGFYTSTPVAQVDALVAEEAGLGPTIQSKMHEWEALEAEYAALERESG